MHSQALVLREPAIKKEVEEKEEKLPSLEELMQPAIFLVEVTKLVTEEVARLQEATGKITQLRKQIDAIQEKLKNVPHPLADKMMAMWDQEEDKRVDPFAGLSDEDIEMKAESLRSTEVKEMRAEVLKLQQVLIAEQKKLRLRSQVVELMNIAVSLSDVMERGRKDLWKLFGDYCYVAAELLYHKLVYYKHQMSHYQLDQYGESRDALQQGFRFYIYCAKTYLPVNARNRVTDLEKLGEKLFQHFNRKYAGYVDTRIPDEDLPINLTRFNIPGHSSHASRYFFPSEETSKQNIDPLERKRRQLQNWMNEFYEIHNPNPIYCPTLKVVEQSLSEDDQQKISQMTQVKKRRFLNEQQSKQYNAAIEKRLAYLQNIMKGEFAWIEDEKTHNQIEIYLRQLLQGKRKPKLNLTPMPVVKNETEEESSLTSGTESEAEDKSSFTPASTDVESEMNSIPPLELPSPALSALPVLEAQDGVKSEADSDVAMQIERSPALIATKTEVIIPFMVPLESFALTVTSSQATAYQLGEKKSVSQVASVLRSPKTTRSVTGKHARDEKDTSIIPSQFWLSGKARRSATLAASAKGFFGSKKQAEEKQADVQESSENKRDHKRRRMMSGGKDSD